MSFAKGIVSVALYTKHFVSPSTGCLMELSRKGIIFGRGWGEGGGGAGGRQGWRDVTIQTTVCKRETYVKCLGH